VAVTRARWIVGGLVGAAALVVAGESLFAYIAAGSIVGVVAVLVLSGVLGVGLASLARARRDIGRELSALAATPPGGALWAARRAKALDLRGRGVEPDLDALAEATAADEAERGFVGKYLVATTILVGLVGTFGGLMETLARVAPLLKGDLGAGGPGGAFALIAGPLAGLHITFGTSVVAILVTLALALIQGDVTLHQERLLALLQERTRHVLVPELWPAEESAAERTVRALLELRAFVGEALTTSATASADKIAGVVRVEVQRLVAQLGAETKAATAAQTAALDRAGAALTDGFRRTTEAAAQELRSAAAASRETMAAAATSAAETAGVVRVEIQRLVAQLGTETQAATAAQTAALERTGALLTDGFQRTTEAAAQELRDAASTSRDTMTTAATAAREAVATAAAASREAVTLAAAASRETFAAAAGESRQAFAEAAAAAREEVTTALATLAATTARASESIAASTEGAVTSLGQLHGTLSAQLEGASQALAAAAGELRGTVGALSPALAELAPQLGALTAEVALLAARAESPDLPNAVLDELVRLAEDVERLLGSNQAAPATTEAAAREAES
jgi:hypothetical protein